MHLLESFALNTGLKIDKPYIYEKFTPAPCKEDYIILGSHSSMPSKTYAYWEEVLEILMPHLSERDIKVVQVGEFGPNVRGAHSLVGKTDLNQLAYMIKRCILYVGVDDLGVHMASHFGKKIVAIYSSFLPSNTGPYWSEEKDTRIIEPDRKEKSPSYFPLEDPQTINTIKPEVIAKAACDLLKIKFNYPYKTIYIGKEYATKKIEVVPTSFVTNVTQLGVDSLICRMDIDFNESVLAKQLQICPCSIVTDKPIDIGLLKRSQLQKMIRELVYFIDDKTDVSYFFDLKKKAIPFTLASKLTGRKLDKIKLKYIDFMKILEIPDGNKKDLKYKGNNKLFFKSSCLSVKGQHVYRSKSKDKRNTSVERTLNLDPIPVLSDKDFWKELDQMIILEKTS